MKLSADFTLERMAETFRNRNTMYGDNWITVGKVMKALYPEGITSKTEEDHIVHHWISWIVGKLTRYVNSGDIESIHDMAVYGAMLETFLLQLEKEKHDR